MTTPRSPAPERRRLRSLLHTARDARMYRRALAVLQVDAGRSVVSVATELGVSRQAVHRWWAALAGRTEAPPRAPGRGRGRPSRWTARALHALETALRGAPDRLGYMAVDWTVPLLIEQVAARGGLRVSDATMRRQLRRLGDT